MSGHPTDAESTAVAWPAVGSAQQNQLSVRRGAGGPQATIGPRSTPVSRPMASPHRESTSPRTRLRSPTLHRRSHRARLWSILRCGVLELPSPGERFGSYLTRNGVTAGCPSSSEPFGDEELDRQLHRVGSRPQVVDSRGTPRVAPGLGAGPGKEREPGRPDMDSGIAEDRHCRSCPPTVWFLSRISRVLSSTLSKALTTNRHRARTSPPTPQRWARMCSTFTVTSKVSSGWAVWAALTTSRL